MKKVIFMVLILFFVIFSQISIAKYDNSYFNNYWLKFYTTEKELGGCGEIRINITNNTITGYQWSLSSMYHYGTETKVEVICSKRYDTLVHSHHTYDVCEFSDYDYAEMLRTHGFFKYWVVLCESDFRIAYIDYFGKITEGTFKR